MTIPARAPANGISADLAVVYWCYSRQGELLYVGCTGNPRLRMSYHERLTNWFVESHWIAMSQWMPRRVALDLELDEINHRGPRCNVRKRLAA